MGRVVTLTERFAFTGEKVSRDGAYPVIRGVLLCGQSSANRRRYLKDYCAGDKIKLYDGVPVFLNHGSGKTSRQYQDKIGSIENPRHRADGMPIGDIAINPKHPYAEAVLFDAEHKPRSCGMSHVAQCETRTAKDGWDDVTALIKAESVDLVVDPATTRGLYEHKERPMSLTVKTFCESLVKHPRTTFAQLSGLKWLAEMDGMDGMEMPADVEPPADDAEVGDHEAAIDTAFESAGHAVWTAFTTGQIDLKEVLSKLKELAKGHGNVKGSKSGATAPTETADTDGDGDTEGDTDDDGDDTYESRKSDYAAALALVTEAKVELPAADLQILADTIPAHRPTLLALFKKVKESKPQPTAVRSAERKPGPGGDKAVTEAKTVPTDGKSFAKSVRE